MRSLFKISCLLFLAGCTGLVSEPGEDPGEIGNGGNGGGSAGVPSTSKDALLPAPRYSRLTHTQWENVVQDLFGLSQPTGLSSAFPADPGSGGYVFENNAVVLQIEDILFQSYQRGASDVAKLVMADSNVLGKIVPAAGGSDEDRAKQFIQEFGLRAYRRPLTDAEVERHLQLYQEAATLYPTLPAFDAGIQHLITAFLLSPHFLYRIESSTEQVGPGIPLNSYELASRLSFTLWNTMPDQALFDAAAQNSLTDPKVLEAQARRLLDDPRAEEVILGFHQRMLHTEKFDEIHPVASLFPGTDVDNLPTYAKEENARFIRDIFQGDGSYVDMLTSNKTYVNDELAKIYGVSGSFGSDFTEVNLDPAKRRGIFTQVGFLAANATSADPDPIHRGAFLVQHISCLPVTLPDVEIPPLPPITGDMTNRENVEAHTEKEAPCVGCHGEYINPYGFPFESYDAVGAWRDTDHGQPVDTTSSPKVDGETKSVSSAVELIDLLAGSTDVHACYARHWIEYTFGRRYLKDDDIGVVTHLGEVSQGGTSVKDLIVNLLTSPAFRSRSTKEMPDYTQEVSP